MFCIYLRTNSDLCHLQHKLIWFHKRNETFLQCGTDWVLKWSLLVTWCTNIFTFNDFYALPTLYLCVLYLSENKQRLVSLHKTIGFYNRHKKCLQRSTDWIFKYSSLRFLCKLLMIIPHYVGHTTEKRISIIKGERYDRIWLKLRSRYRQVLKVRGCCR
jgi:hypothetical protein